ncbi:related to Reticuline oxidase precursor [Ustilago trichophora]|uniref:Related to Reticuline oxidase n=1 Tax=Ustilago trichophora TaxID=86804 RepID=A0A5C3EC54_9BASI|nr:related to Reticuline oxidase precursor [Ustilago trichophora]
MASAKLTLLAAAFTLLSPSLTSAFPVYTFDPSTPSLFPRSSDSDSTNSLRQCLSSSGGYDQAYSTSSDYATLRSSYNPLFDYKPLVITVPTTEADVSSIVKCVSAEGGKQKLSPRSGGHSYEAYSLGGQDGSVVIDLRHLDTITVDKAAKKATVGAGVRLGTLAQKIWDQGEFALPHGTCPMVGVGGHALGGGFGFTTRAWGFLLDRITEMNMVDRDGNVLTVTNDKISDLWWALRGGGANNFGIVTSFTFSLESAPKHILNFSYSYKTNQDCAKAIVALQQLTLSSDSQTGFEPGFGGELLIAGQAAGDFDNNACRLSGQHINTSRASHDHLINLFHVIAGIKPSQVQVKPFTSWIQSLVDIMGSLDVRDRAGKDHEQFYAKSLVQPLIPTYNYDSALKLVNKLNAYANLQGTGNSISFDFLGPLSYSATKVKTQESSFNAHKAAFIYQFYSYGFPDNDNPQAQKQVHEAYDDLVNTAKSSNDNVQWGAYVNYVDARLQDWPKAYYGDSLTRLKHLKKKWDPENIFDFPQGLAHA